MSVLSSRTRRILEAPVLPLLLSLALPNIGEAAARITFLTADALFVSWLGSDALAGAAVVFPLFLILQTATASGVGSGVSSAIGRALGAGDHERARSLAGVAVAITLIGAAATTVLMTLVGPRLYAAMDLAPGPLEMATLYGGVLFGGSGLVWSTNLLANVSRGAGNMIVPAFAIAIGEVFHLALSPLLVLGWGPVPALGIVGAALAALAAYAVGTLVLVLHLVSRHALVPLAWRRLRWRSDEARDFFRAWRVAQVGAAVAGAIGLVFAGVALFGANWMSLFTADPAIRASGALYLLYLAAVFPLTGVGLAAYFACVAIGHVAIPFLLAALRVAVVIVGGWLALRLGGGLAGIALASAAAFALFGVVVFLVARSRFGRLTKPGPGVR